MKRIAAAVLSTWFLAACSDPTLVTPDGAPSAAEQSLLLVASGRVLVVNSNDAGPGSFRDAVTQANGDPSITRVRFLGGVGTIVLSQTIAFTGTQALTIDGNSAILDGAGAAGAAFRASGGGDIAVSNLTVQNSPGDGIAVDVPAAATGIIHLSLFKVNAIDNAGFGVILNDQVDPTTADGVQPNAGGSAASVAVSVVNSRFIRNGYSVSDRDGLRVNEGGDGDLSITIKHSLAEDNAADGIEVDERGAGSILIDMFGTTVARNGRLDPADLDDGFDVDEYNDGSILGTIFSSSASDNYEEGFDINENNAGDLRLDLQNVEASRNGEEGIDYEEDDDFAGGGDLITTMRGITADGNGVALDGDAGLKIREKGAGNLHATVDGAQTSNNLFGGISVREDGVGNLAASINKATSLGNAGHGIDFDENRLNSGDGGSLTATVSNSTSSANGGFGVRADQQTPGVGTLLLMKVTLDGNIGGTTTGNGVAVTIQP